MKRNFLTTAEVKLVLIIIAWVIIIGGPILVILNRYTGPSPNENVMPEMSEEKEIHSSSITTYQKSFIKMDGGLRMSRKNNFSESEINLLAGLIEAEVGQSSKTLREQVGIVALNRVKSELFPNSLFEVVYEEVYGVPAYDTAKMGLIPNEPKEENIQIARNLTRIFSSGEKEWKSFCEYRLLTEKAVFEANDYVDQSEYANEILSVSGTIGKTSYCIIFWESKYDTSENSTYNVIIDK